MQNIPRIFELNLKNSTLRYIIIKSQRKKLEMNKRKETSYMKNPQKATSGYLKRNLASQDRVGGYIQNTGRNKSSKSKILFSVKIII